MCSGFATPTCENIGLKARQPNLNYCDLLGSGLYACCHAVELAVVTAAELAIEP
jgi:hypothetical protein